MDYVFIGIVCEFLCMEGNSCIYLLGDLLFNLFVISFVYVDWENLYFVYGDGVDGENVDVIRYVNLQSFVVFGGKILCINVVDFDGVGVQCYGILVGNLFVVIVGVCGEIWVYGFCNLYWFLWDIDLVMLVVVWFLVNDIGFYDVEEVNIVVVGGNYGWVECEGL